MLKIKEIDEKIRKLEKEAYSTILKALHGELSWERARELELEYQARKRELEKIKLEQIPNAKEFVEFAKNHDLYCPYLINHVKDDDIVTAVKLFLKIPLKHRKFVLEASYIEYEAKNPPNEKWLKKVYKPLKALTRQSKIDLPTHEKAKLLDLLLKKSKIDVFTFKKLLERGEVELKISPSAKFGELDEDGKIREWLKNF